MILIADAFPVFMQNIKSVKDVKQLAAKIPKSVMEFFPMTLKDLIAKKWKFTDKEIESFLGQMGSALETAHFKIPKPIIHCDIKPSNIGVRKLSPGQYHYKLMDFDVSMELDEQNHQSLFSSSTGYTPGYSPPEQVMAFMKNKGVITNAIDIYSIGIIALQMQTGVPPSSSINNLRPKLSLHLCNYKWEKVFRQLCNPDPKKRPPIINEIIYPTKENDYTLVLKILLTILVVLFITILVITYFSTN